MATYVEIANLAASSIGEDDQLRAPGDDTHLGRTIAAVWDVTRRAALRDHPWNFALRRVGLAAEALDVAPIGWGYRYPLPDDFLRVVDLLDCPARDDFEVEGGAILCNRASPLGLRYIADVAEPANFDALFVEAFAARLAFQIADRITGDRGRKNDAWAAYQAALKSAKRVDALENPGPVEDWSPWEEARIAGPGARWDRYRYSTGPYIPGP